MFVILGSLYSQLIEPKQNTRGLYTQAVQTMKLLALLKKAINIIAIEDKQSWFRFPPSST